MDIEILREGTEFVVRETFGRRVYETRVEPINRSRYERDIKDVYSDSLHEAWIKKVKLGEELGLDEWLKSISAEEKEATLYSPYRGAAESMIYDALAEMEPSTFIDEFGFAKSQDMRALFPVLATIGIGNATFEVKRECGTSCFVIRKKKNGYVHETVVEPMYRDEVYREIVHGDMEYWHDRWQKEVLDGETSDTLMEWFCKKPFDDLVDLRFSPYRGPAAAMVYEALERESDKEELTRKAINEKMAWFGFIEHEQPKRVPARFEYPVLDIVADGTQ
jgi:hypothetical protein